MISSPSGNRNSNSPAKRLHAIFNQYGKAVHQYFEHENLCADIPSHDFSHHLRVWHYGVDLTERLYHSGFEFTDRFLNQLTIAALMHDTGLTVEQGAKHGKAGAEICARFMKQQNIPEETGREILEAIICHDDKEYILSHRPESLTAIVSVADDADAFSYTGIYRYTEIYLKRGIESGHLASEIVINAASRLANIRKVYGFLNDYIDLQESRFNILFHFFTDNGQRAAETREAVTEGIRKMVLNKHKSITDAITAYSGIKCALSAPFFNMLLDELKAAENAPGIRPSQT